MEAGVPPTRCRLPGGLGGSIRAVGRDGKAVGMARRSGCPASGLDRGCPRRGLFVALRPAGLLELSDVSGANKIQGAKRGTPAAHDGSGLVTAGPG